MHFEVKSVKPAKQKTDVAIIAVFADKVLGATARALNKACNGLIADALANGDIDASPGSTLLLPTKNLACGRILLVGCGPRDKLDRKNFRKAVSSALTSLKNKPYPKIALYLTLEKIRLADAERLGAICAATWLDVSYRFTRMKSEDSAPKESPTSMTIAATPGSAAAVRKGVKMGKALGLGMQFGRDLANLPGNVCTPSYLAKQARALASSNSRLNCKVLSEADMHKLGMGSLLSVTAGSAGRTSWTTSPTPQRRRRPRASWSHIARSWKPTSSPYG